MHAFEFKLEKEFYLIYQVALVEVFKVIIIKISQLVNLLLFYNANSFSICEIVSVIPLMMTIN